MTSEQIWLLLNHLVFQVVLMQKEHQLMGAQSV